MRLVFTLCVAMLAGCIDAPPQHKRPRPQPSVQPQQLRELVLVTRDDCLYCEKQKQVFASMNLSSWRVSEVNHSSQPQYRSSYPARAYPTIYVRRGGSPEVYTGYMNEQQLKSVLGP